MPALRVQEMEPLDLELLRQFVGETAAETLEEVLEALVENGAPLFVWPGDLRVEENTSSAQLLAGRTGFEAPHGDYADARAFTIFINGDLDVTGVLRVDQYHNLYVKGNLRARSIVSHTGNLLVKGQIVADEIVAFDCNEEGGFLHGASCDVPLLCRFGDSYWYWAVSNAVGKKELWENNDDPEFAALVRALESNGVEPTWFGLVEIVTSGRTAELLSSL